MTPLHAIFVCAVTFMQPQVPVPYPIVVQSDAAVAHCGHGAVGGVPQGCYVNLGNPGSRGTVFLREGAVSHYYAAWEMARAVQHARGDWGTVSVGDMRTEAMAVARECGRG